LRAGEFPLWFRFTEEGPVLIETIEAARYSAALIPWPHAPHAGFMLARDGELLMAVNRDGFVRMSPWRARDGTEGIGMYHVSGGGLWQQYTVGAFVLPAPGENPVALLYRNDWFLYRDIPPPSPRLWAFDAYSAEPVAFSLPSLDAFPPEEGWDLDVLRMGGSGHWYFRAGRNADGEGANENEGRRETRLLRTRSLEREGESVSLAAFHDAARPRPLSDAPPPLREKLAAAFAETAPGFAHVVSPGFPDGRRFSAGGEGPELYAFFSPGAFLLAAQPQGDAAYVETGSPGLLPVRFSLPSLPESFVYTGIGMVEDTVFATWEERVGFSIGAAGFMAIRPAELAGRGIDF